MSQGENPGGFVCTHCGSAAARIFDEYSQDCIEVALCECCKQVVDSYVELEPTVVILRFLLFRTAAFRHLCNVHARKDILSQGARRLFVLARVAEAYIAFSCTTFASSLQQALLFSFALSCSLLALIFAVSSQFIVPSRRAALALSLVFATAYPLLLLPVVLFGAATPTLVPAMAILQLAAIARTLWLHLAQR
eukprot:m.64609 g.64609  ORF g.64609 m.64609 type:complete len:193 (-) comp12536_c0_seq4:1509-2087(-)